MQKTSRETKIVVGTIVVILIVVFLVLINPYISDAEVRGTKIGEVTNINRIGPRDDKIKIFRVDDPENPFVSIYVTQVKAGEILAISDPSNSAIACRLTGTIPVDEDGNQVINTSTNYDIGHFRKSIGSKIMKIGRWYDREKHCLVYVVYTTKLLGGSSKHSLSVVPLKYPSR